MIHYLSKAKSRSLQGVALLRLDFNTEDDWRLRAAIPTVKFLLSRADHVLIISHRGRPTGFEKKFSLRKDAQKLQQILGKPIMFIPHFRFGEIKKRIAQAPRKSIFILENLRFLSGEETNNVKLGKTLASLGNYYVNDAFAVSHRANASVVAVTKFMKSLAGLELEKEIKTLSHVLKIPAHPFVIILGGSKAHDKLGVLAHFKRKADAFLLGGGSANTLLMMKGMDVKKSIHDADPGDIKKLRPVLHYPNLVLPVDFGWNKEKILDIGPKTIALFKNRIRTARTIFWSGPMGQIEIARYAKGNLAVTRAIAANRKALSITGGGETVMFLKKYKLDKKFSFISTGGGAMMEFLAGEKLPGIEALK